MVVVVLGACGGSKPAPPSQVVSNVVPVSTKPEPKQPDPPFVPATCDDGDNPCFLRQLTGFTTEMCKCKVNDTACAQKVTDLFTKWGTEVAKHAQNRTRPDPDMAKQAGEIMTRYTECMTKAMMPAADPCAGSSAPPTP